MKNVKLTIKLQNCLRIKMVLEVTYSVQNTIFISSLCAPGKICLKITLKMI